MVLLLAGCQSDPALHSERIGPGHYRLVVDRCHVIDQEQLERDLRDLADTQCPGAAGALETVESLPSRQGSLLGECLRRGALRAEVRCR
ncbi:hypothetical protein [Stenotrophomonas sp.]|uniref:hypothetical protein n=1 Tax=Stenotrophomonas sp. TaxID=69392 RepID=UPI0025D7652E|nr:hypothetical protein [Stenotrophomonas sp.]